ncbi:unnamed protein product [Meganyctiphanes norvegica]|uniref:BHLH domain-containing protein n=1 Tax=Meganyctiphanes norvegica TaxID=48144 RepID=A0AAV2SB97_MEGNR
MGIGKKNVKESLEIKGKKNSTKPPKIKNERKIEDKTQMRKWEAARRKRFNDILENLRLELPDNEHKVKAGIIQAAIDYIKECKAFKENSLSSNGDNEWKREIHRLRRKVKSLKENNALLLKILKEAGLQFESRGSRGETFYTMPGTCVQSDCVNVTRKRIYIDRTPSADDDQHSESADEPTVGETVFTDYGDDDDNNINININENEIPNQMLRTCAPICNTSITNNIKFENSKSHMSSRGTLQLVNDTALNDISKPVLPGNTLKSSLNVDNIHKNVQNISKNNPLLGKKTPALSKDLRFISNTAQEIQTIPDSIKSNSISEKIKAENHLGININIDTNYNTKDDLVANDNEAQPRNHIILERTEVVQSSTNFIKSKSPVHIAPNVNETSESDPKSIDITNRYQLVPVTATSEIEPTVPPDLSGDLKLTNKMSILPEKISAVSSGNFSVFNPQCSTFSKDIMLIKKINVVNDENHKIESIKNQILSSHRNLSLQTTDNNIPCSNKEIPIQKLTMAPFEESVVQNITSIPMVNNEEEQITIVSESCSTDEVDEENLTIQAKNNLYVASEDGDGTVTVNIVESPEVISENVNSDPIEFGNNLKSLHLNVNQQDMSAIRRNLSNVQGHDININKSHKNLFLSQDETCIVLQELPQHQTTLQTEFQQNHLQHNAISNVNQPNIVTLHGNDKTVNKNTQKLVLLQCANTCNTIQLIPPMIESQQLTYVTPSLSNAPIMSTGIPGRMVRMVTPNGPQMVILPPPLPQSFITTFTPQPPKLKPIAPKPCACKVSPTKSNVSESCKKLLKNTTSSTKKSTSHNISKSPSKSKRSIQANICKSDEPPVKRGRNDCGSASLSNSLQGKVDEIPDKTMLPNVVDDSEVTDNGLQELSSSALTGLVQTAGLMDCDEGEPLENIMDIPEEIQSIAVDSVGIEDPGNVSDDRLVEMLRSIGESDHHNFSPPLTPDKDSNRLFKANDELTLKETKQCTSPKVNNINNNMDINNPLKENISISVKDTDEKVDTENIGKSRTENNSVCSNQNISVDLSNRLNKNNDTVVSTTQNAPIENSLEISSYSITALCSSSRTSEPSKTSYSKPMDYGSVDNNSDIKTTTNAIIYSISQNETVENTSSVSLSDKTSEVSSCLAPTSVVHSLSQVSMAEQLKINQSITDQIIPGKNLSSSIALPPPSIFLGSPVIAATPPPILTALPALPTPPPMGLSLPLPHLPLDHYSTSHISPIISTTTLTHSISNLTTVNSMSPSTLSHSSSSVIGSSHHSNSTKMAGLSTIFSNISSVPTSHPPLLPPTHLQTRHSHPHCLSTPSPTFSFSLSMPTNSVSSSSSVTVTSIATTSSSTTPVSTEFSLKSQDTCVTLPTTENCIMTSKLVTSTPSKSTFDNSSVSIPFTDIKSNSEKNILDGITESLPLITSESMTNIYTEAKSVSKTKMTNVNSSTVSFAPSSVSQLTSVANSLQTTSCNSEIIPTSYIGSNISSFNSSVPGISYSSSHFSNTSLQSTSSKYTPKCNSSVSSYSNSNELKKICTHPNTTTSSSISSLPSPSISPYPSISCMSTVSMSPIFNMSNPKASLNTNSDKYNVMQTFTSTPSPVVTNSIFTTRSSDTILSQTLSKSSMQLSSVSSPIYSVTSLSSGLPFAFNRSYAETSTSQSSTQSQLLSVTSALAATLPNNTLTSTNTSSLCLPISSGPLFTPSLSVGNVVSSVPCDAVLSKPMSTSSSYLHTSPSTVQSLSSSVTSVTSSLTSAPLSTVFPTVPSSSTSPLPLNLWFHSPEKQIHQSSPSKVKYDASKPYYVFSHSPHNTSRTIYDSPETPYKLSKPLYDPTLAPPTPIKNTTLSHIPVMPLNLKGSENESKNSSSKNILTDDNNAKDILKVTNETSKTTSKVARYGHGISEIQEGSKVDKELVKEPYNVESKTAVSCSEVSVEEKLIKEKDSKAQFLLTENKSSASVTSLYEEKGQNATVSKLSVCNITKASSPTNKVEPQLISNLQLKTDTSPFSKNSNSIPLTDSILDKASSVSKETSSTSITDSAIHNLPASAIIQQTPSQAVHPGSDDPLPENMTVSNMVEDIQDKNIYEKCHSTETLVSSASDKTSDYFSCSNNLTVKAENSTNKDHASFVSTKFNDPNTISKVVSLERTGYTVNETKSAEIFKRSDLLTKQDLQTSVKISETNPHQPPTNSQLSSKSCDKKLDSHKVNLKESREEFQENKEGICQKVDIQSHHLSGGISRNEEKLIHTIEKSDSGQRFDNQVGKNCGKFIEGKMWNSNEEINAKNVIVTEKPVIKKTKANSLKQKDTQLLGDTEKSTVEAKYTKREKIEVELKSNKELYKGYENKTRSNEQVPIIGKSTTDSQCSKQQQQQHQQQQQQQQQQVPCAQQRSPQDGISVAQKSPQQSLQSRMHAGMSPIAASQIQEPGNTLHTGYSYANKYSPVSSRKHMENILGSPNSEFENHSSQMAVQAKKGQVIQQHHVQHHLSTDNVTAVPRTSGAGMSNMTSQTQPQINTYQTNQKQEMQQPHISQHRSIAHNNVPLNQSQISIQKHQQQRQISHQHQQRSSQQQQQQQLVGHPTLPHGNSMLAHSVGTGSTAVPEMGEGSNKSVSGAQIVGGLPQVASGAVLSNSMQNQQTMSYPMVSGGSGYMQTPTYEYNSYNCSPRKSNPHSPRSDNRHQCYGYKQHQYQHSDLLPADPMMTDEQSQRIQHSAPMPNMNFMEVSDEPITMRSETSSDPVRYFSVSHLVSHSNETRNKTSGNQQKESTNSPDEKSNKESPRSKSSSRKSDTSKSRGNTSKSSNTQGDIPTHSRRRSPGRGSQNLNSIGPLPTMWGNKPMVSSHKQSHNYSTEALLSTQNYGRSVHRPPPPVPNQNYPIMAHNQMYQTNYSPQQMKNFVPNAATFGYTSHDRNQGGCNTDYNFQLHAAQPSGTLAYGGNMAYMPTGYPYQNLQCSSSSMLSSDIMMPHTSYPRFHDFQTDQTNFPPNPAFPLPFEPQDMSGGSGLMGSGSTMPIKAPTQHHEMAQLAVGNVSSSAGVPYSRSNNTRNSSSTSSHSSASTNSGSKRARYGDTTTSNMMSGMGPGSSGNLLEGGALAHISIHSFTPPCDDSTLVHSNLFPPAGVSSRHQSNFLLGTENMSTVMPGINAPGHHHCPESSSVTSNSSSTSGVMAGAPGGNQLPGVTANVPGGTQRSGVMVLGSAAPPPGHMTFSPLRMMDRQQMAPLPAPSAPHLSSSLSNFNLTSIIPDIDSKGADNSGNMGSSRGSGGGVTTNEASDHQQGSLISQSSRSIPTSMPTSIIPSATDHIKSLPPDSNRLPAAVLNNSMNNIFSHPTPHQVSLSLNSSLPLPPTSFTGINFNPADH